MKKYKFTFIRKRRIHVEVEASNGIEAETLALDLSNAKKTCVQEFEASQRILFVDVCGFDSMTETEWTYWKDKI